MNNETILQKVWNKRHQQEALFLEIIKDYKIEFSPKHTDSVFYTKENNILLEYDKRTYTVYCNSSKVWNIYRDKFNLDGGEIIILLNKLCHLYLQIYPYPYPAFNERGWDMDKQLYPGSDYKWYKDNIVKVKI